MKLEIDVTPEQFAYLQEQAPRTGLSLNDWLLWKLLPPSRNLPAPSIPSSDDRLSTRKEISGEMKASIFEMLEHIQRRPASYLGKADDIESLDHFLNGFGAGLFSQGVRFTRLDLSKAMRAHGYEASARVDFVYEQMRERGLSDEEMVRERMMLEIEMWEIYFADPHGDGEHERVAVDEATLPETESA